MEEIISLLKEEYLRPIFYFMLKKTSNHYEAEDLSQEVIYEILNSLNHGMVPHDINAWIWQIARNRYARWAGRKNKYKNYISISEFADTLADNEDVSDTLIAKEDLYELRRELQLLHSDYSKIVAEYYFNNHSIADIARMVSLPIGTVKRKLHECRKHLKEGIKMSRTYGTRSFNPDDIVFIQNWSKGESGHKYVERKTPKNILLEAYDNPSTAEDLSLALGIAMPYMEEEIEILYNVGLLIKDKQDRYLTNCTIISKQAQVDVDNKMIEIGKKLNPLIIETIESLNDAKLFGGYQNFDEMKMTLIVMLITEIKFGSPSKYVHIQRTPRMNDSEWDLMGFEKVERKFKTCGLYGMSNIFPSQLVVPEIHGMGDRDTTLFTDEESIALKNLMKDDVKESDITHLDKLCERNIVKKISTDIYEPMFAVVTESEFNRMIDLVNESHYKEVAELIKEYLIYTTERYKKDIPNYLKDKPWDTQGDNFRTCVLEYAIDTGYIKVPDNPSNSAVGLWCWNV